jgi:hypothetical protein
MYLNNKISLLDHQVELQTKMQRQVKLKVTHSKEIKSSKKDKYHKSSYWSISLN